jgi:hypothetical protein
MQREEGIDDESEFKGQRQGNDPNLEKGLAGNGINSMSTVHMWMISAIELGIGRERSIMRRENRQVEIHQIGD